MSKVNKFIRVPFLTNKEINLNEPQVGIYYCVEKTVYYDSINLSDAEPYGDFLIYNQNHLYFWDMLRKKEPSIIQHDEYYYPRGRIMYNKPIDTFQILSDPCIINQQFLESLVGALSLKLDKTIILEDDHYVCHKCNSKRGYDLLK